MIIVVGIVGGGLFGIVKLVALAKDSIPMISRWIHRLFSEQVSAVTHFGVRAGQPVGSMTLHRLRTGRLM